MQFITYGNLTIHIYIYIKSSRLLLFYQGKLLTEESLAREFGNSKEMVKSVVVSLQRKSNLQNALIKSIEAAKEVGNFHYEYQTSWGKTVIPL